VVGGGVGGGGGGGVDVGWRGGGGGGGGGVKSTVLSMILMSIKGWAHQNWIRIGCYPRKIDKWAITKNKLGRFFFFGSTICYTVLVRSLW